MSVRDKVVEVFTESGEYRGIAYLNGDKYWMFGIDFGLSTIDVKEAGKDNAYPRLSIVLDREKKRKELWNDIINNRKPIMMYGNKVTPKGQILFEVTIPVPKSLTTIRYRDEFERKGE